MCAFKKYIPLITDIFISIAVIPVTFIWTIIQDLTVLRKGRQWLSQPSTSLDISLCFHSEDENVSFKNR